MYTIQDLIQDIIPRVLRPTGRGPWPRPLQGRFVTDSMFDTDSGMEDSLEITDSDARPQTLLYSTVLTYTVQYSYSTVQ